MRDDSIMANGSNGRSPDRDGPRPPLAPIATLLDLYRVGGLSNPRDLRTLAQAMDDPWVVRSLAITEREIADIRRRADAAHP